MSHMVIQKAHFKSIQALINACMALGTIEFVKGQTTFKWFGSWQNDFHSGDAAYKNGYDPKDFGKCLHAIRVKGNTDAYEIGVVAARDANGKLVPGEYALMSDFWSGGKGLMEAVSSNGKNCNLIEQQYMIEQAKLRAAHLTQAGWRVETVMGANGHKQLHLTEPGGAGAPAVYQEDLTASAT